VMEVAEKLQSEENISIEVVDPRTIRPFDEATIIGVQVNSFVDYKEAYILIRDLNGKELKRLPIDLNNEFGEVVYTHGYGHVGTYMYTLIVDGQERGTKRMVFAN